MTQFDVDCRGTRNQFSEKTAIYCSTDAARNTLTIASCTLYGNCIDGVTNFQERTMKVQGESKATYFDPCSIHVIAVIVNL
jgi:hypothetical protein